MARGSAPAGLASTRLAPARLAGFTGLVALLAIFADAALGHGLVWENDPYWSYWVTKTFLIATIFGLGTAWLGVGVGAGAIITAVHTLVLTIYYWTLSPIGLPSHPEWLDLHHTWITGVPIHFGVIYLGYLVALWIWRRTVAPGPQALDSGPLAIRALAVGTIILVLAGGLTSLVLGEFPGITWFVVRLLVTVTFLLLWWGAVGRDRVAALVGGVTLALVWATYAQFVGPSGLPDFPLRLLDPAPPGATAYWLSYTELWLVSLPLYAAVMLAVLSIDARGRGGEGRRSTVGAAALVGILLLSGFGAGPEGAAGVRASVSASGPVLVERGSPFSDEFVTGVGELTLEAEDMGARVSPLPPHDRLAIAATIESAGAVFEVEVARPMVEDPSGRHTTWWGVGLGVDHHGRSGIGTGDLPPITSEIAVFGLGTVSLDGREVAGGVPVHVMTAEEGLPQDARVELDVGDHQTPVPGLPDGHLRVLWSTASVRSEAASVEMSRYLGGGIVLLLALGGALYLNRRPTPR